MASISAKKAGEKVLENLGKGKKPNLGKIAREIGYADNTADNPKNITETKSFKEVIDPVVNRWIKLREKFTKSLEDKDLDKEQVRTIVDSIDTLTKNIQLLTGGKTENTGIGELAETVNSWINSKK
jgi:hypothetical protein